jgi:hypothetical protein
LKEAGAESLSFQLLNRNVDQPLNHSLLVTRSDRFLEMRPAFVVRGSRPALREGPKAQTPRWRGQDSNRRFLLQPSWSLRRNENTVRAENGRRESFVKIGWTEGSNLVSSTRGSVANPIEAGPVTKAALEALRAITPTDLNGTWESNISRRPICASMVASSKRRCRTTAIRRPAAWTRGFLVRRWTR